MMEDEDVEDEIETLEELGDDDEPTDEDILETFLGI